MSDESVAPPIRLTADTVWSGWRTMKTVYYANSVSWRAFKSGALVFFGFFLWSSSNLLLSYQPAWSFLYYPMAYGFVLIPYGPVHHLVVIPAALRLRRRADAWSRVGRHLPNAGLVVFLVLVLILGSVPTLAGPMTFDFQSALDDAGADVNPDLACVKSTGPTGATVHCHLTESAGVDSVVVESGGERLRTDEEPPFDFTVREDELTTVVGQKQFQVVLLDEDGDTIRRYTRTLGMIPEG